MIVDDFSTEDITPTIDAYRHNLNIRYIRNKQNIGCGMSRQVGIDNATTKYITFLDSDDMFMPYTIEVFRSVVSSSDVEYLHTHFYEQTIINGSPALYLHKDNYTACHGKLYNVEKIRELGIKNSPLVRWADDSFFNSMCSELLRLSTLGIPTMLWTNNPNSVMRCRNEERDRLKKLDFLTAMQMSAEFVMQKKGHVEHLGGTLARMAKDKTLTDSEREILTNLTNTTKKG